MPQAISRRAAIGSVIAVAMPAIVRAQAPGHLDLKAAEEYLKVIEERIGGRVGATVVDTGNGMRIQRRGDEMFPMCSTFKFLAAAAVLRRIDAGRARLDQRIPYGADDLLDYAPVTRARVGDGGMALGELCAAAVELSDNTAGNLLLREIGGPEALTQFMRSIGDTKTRLDRTEPTLNTAIPGDPRDTTTPNAMVASMAAILLGSSLSTPSRDHLERWLRKSKTGGTRLRAGVPTTWRVGDKTGAGANATANTIAILRPPGREPLLAAVYCTGSSAPPIALDMAHADVARMVTAVF